MAGNRLIISNTTPLINFAEIGCYDLLERRADERQSPD